MAVIMESVVCTGCACLCDDLDVTLEGEQVVAVANVCRWGVNRFYNGKKFHPHKERRRLTNPQLRRQGRLVDVTYEEALGQAAAILTQAQRPLIYGLTHLGCTAQEAALELARKLRARLEPPDLRLMVPYFQSLKKHGLFLAPLDVIRDQADAVIFWGANPLHSVPRHLVRYSAFARGRFTERGLEDRRLAAVDIYRSELAECCHLFVELNPGQELTLINQVTAKLAGREEPGEANKGARQLAELLSQASYAAIFCGRGVSYGPAGEILDRLGEMAARLNQVKPLALLALSSDFNAAGLYHLFLRELGAVGAPDFAAGSLSIQISPLNFTEVDAILVAGADLWWLLPEADRQSLLRRRVPLILISPFADRTSSLAEVILPVALTGVETEDFAYRLDGLPLRLKKIRPSFSPPEHLVLNDLQLFL